MQRRRRGAQLLAGDLDVVAGERRELVLHALRGGQGSVHCGGGGGEVEFEAREEVTTDGSVKSEKYQPKISKKATTYFSQQIVKGPCFGGGYVEHALP